MDHSRRRLVLYSAIGVVAFLIVAAGGSYKFIRSPAGSRFLIAQAKSLAFKSSGITLSIGDGVVDPFSGLHLHRVKASRTGLELAIDAVDIDYRLSVFSREVTVDRFVVDHPVLSMSGPVPSTEGAKPAAVEPATSPPGEDPITRAAKLVTFPPGSVRVRQLLVEHIGVDVALEGPDKTGTKISTKIHDGKLEGTLELIASHLAFSGTAAFPEISDIAYVTEGTIVRVARASLAGNFEAAVHADKGGWAYEITPSGADLELGNLVFGKAGAAPPVGVTLASAKLELKAKLAAHTAELFHLDPNSVQSLESDSKLVLGALEVRQAARRTLVGSQNADLAMRMGKDIEFAVTYDADRTQLLPPPTPMFAKPVRLDWKTSGTIAHDFTRIDSKSAARWDDRALLDAEFTAASSGASNGASGGISAKGSAQLFPDVALMAALLPAAARKQISGLRADAAFSTELKGAFPSLLVTAAAASHAQTGGKFEVKLTQVLVAKDKPSAHFQPIGFSAEFSRQGGASQSSNGSEPWQVKLSADAPELRSSLLPNPAIPLRMQFAGDLHVDPTNNRADVDGHLNVQDEEALKFHSHVETPAPGQIHATSTLAISTGDYLSRAGLLTAEKLKAFGRWAGEAQLELSMNAGRIKSEGSAKLSQVRDAGAIGSPVILKEPIVVTEKLLIDPSRKQTDGELIATVPSVELPKTASIQDSRFTAAAHSAADGAVDFTVALAQGAITLSPAIAAQAPALAGLNIKASGSVRPSGAFTLTRLEGDFDRSIIRFEAAGDGQGKDAQARGTMVLQIPPDFPRIAGALGRGRVEFPWRLSVLRGKEIIFEGQAQVAGMSWSYVPTVNAKTSLGAVGASGISGNIPISEKLLWDGRHLHFTDLITQNPFERVDFERVRPMMESETQFRVDQLTWEERKFGPFIGFFSLKQNMILAPQFDLELGHDSGHVYGEMYFDAYPSNLQFGLLSRVTGINLAEVLPKRFLTKMPGGDKNVSARSGLVVDFNKGTVDGRVDVTEIGSSQLLLMINVLDPKYEDEKMNKMRNLLGLGYPTFVAMAFSDGYLDMGMDLVALGIAQHQDLRGIPISPWISSATSDLVKKTQEGPLE